MPPDTNKPGVSGGVTEACLFNDHSMCNNPRCGCTCHIKASSGHGGNSPDGGHRPEQVETGPEKSCPTCGVKRPFREIYCRIDGARLSSLACNVCGFGREPEDKFCCNCGSPAGAEKPAELPHVINVPKLEEQPAVDYAKTILAGIQEELGNDGPIRESHEPQVVVETPNGTQGSFKLVSKPNPNKIRIPAGGRQETGPPTQTAKPARRLPIKPS